MAGQEMGIPTSTVLWALGIALPTITGLIVFAIRLMIAGLRVEFEAELKAITRSVEDITADRASCEKRKNHDINRIEATLSRLQEEWRQTTRDSVALETERAMRLDAVFTVLDGLKEELRGVRPALIDKVDELERRLKLELQGYVNDQLRK